MAKDVQIIPPPRAVSLSSPRPIQPPRIHSPYVESGGVIESVWTEMKSEYQVRGMNALATRTRSQTALYESQAAMLEAYAKREKADYHLSELPEILANDRAQRRVERAEELRKVQHKYELAEAKRMTELAHAEAVLTDARQGLQAQRDFGYSTYELMWKNKLRELLDVELDVAERRAMLRDHFEEMDRKSGRGTSASRLDDLDQALMDTRTEMRASGLDTSKLDEIIERRKR